MSSLLEKNQYENGEQTVSVVNGGASNQDSETSSETKKFKTVILNIHLNFNLFYFILRHLFEL